MTNIESTIKRILVDDLFITVPPSEIGLDDNFRDVLDSTRSDSPNSAPSVNTSSAAPSQTRTSSQTLLLGPDPDPVGVSRQAALADEARVQ